MQGEHWIIIANSRHKLYFADAVDRSSFLTQHYEQIMPEPLQSHPSVRGFYAIYAAFHLFKFRQEGITGVRDVNVHSFISYYMQYFILFNVNVQVKQCVRYYLYSLNNFVEHSFNHFT